MKDSIFYLVFSALVHLSIQYADVKHILGSGGGGPGIYGASGSYSQSGSSASSSSSSFSTSGTFSSSSIGCNTGKCPDKIQGGQVPSSGCTGTAPCATSSNTGFGANVGQANGGSSGSKVSYGGSGIVNSGYAGSYGPGSAGKATLGHGNGCGTPDCDNGQQGSRFSGAGVHTGSFVSASSGSGSYGSPGSAGKATLGHGSSDKNHGSVSYGYAPSYSGTYSSPGSAGQATLGHSYFGVGAGSKTGTFEGSGSQTGTFGGSGSQTGTFGGSGSQTGTYGSSGSYHTSREKSVKGYGTVGKDQPWFNPGTSGCLTSNCGTGQYGTEYSSSGSSLDQTATNVGSGSYGYISGSAGKATLGHGTVGTTHSGPSPGNNGCGSVNCESGQYGSGFSGVGSSSGSFSTASAASGSQSASHSGYGSYGTHQSGTGVAPASYPGSPIGSGSYGKAPVYTGTATLDYGKERSGTYVGHSDHTAASTNFGNYGATIPTYGSPGHHGSHHHEHHKKHGNHGHIPSKHNGHHPHLGSDRIGFSVNPLVPGKYVPSPTGGENYSGPESPQGSGTYSNSFGTSGSGSHTTSYGSPRPVSSGKPVVGHPPTSYDPPPHGYISGSDTDANAASSSYAGVSAHSTGTTGIVTSPQCGSSSCVPKELAPHQQDKNFDNVYIGGADAGRWWRKADKGGSFSGHEHHNKGANTGNRWWEDGGDFDNEGTKNTAAYSSSNSSSSSSAKSFAFSSSYSHAVSSAHSH